MVVCNVDIETKSRSRRTSTSGFRLLDADQCDTVSSISKHSVYKQKIDAMFDDSRSIISQRVLDLAPAEQAPRVSNSVQAQIERMFTDVARDTSSGIFSVRCLGSLPLRDKVTSLQGLQDPLTQLYIGGKNKGSGNGSLDICPSGLRVRKSGSDPIITPFQCIAVWSAVKFVIGGNGNTAAFLPLITDPDNIDKQRLFRPISTLDRKGLEVGAHSPLFTVVMRTQQSSGLKQLECHGFVCNTSEDAIVIAATLYQALMSHMGNSKSKKPKNRNGISCVSIASSVAPAPIPPPVRPPRKKRSAASSLSGDSDNIQDANQHKVAEDRKKKSSKNKRAPPAPPVVGKQSTSTASFDIYNASMNYLNEQSRTTRAVSNAPIIEQNFSGNKETGDILTRVAIPRSGSFLNAGGLTRYKTRGPRRGAAGGGGGGGGSPLGFSELFAEFRLQENLHSLDEILGAIIDCEGMSFNDLKPIYKEFLLKLAVTLTKDELYQRSKSIMRRQKKKLRRRNSSAQNQRKKMIIGSKGLRKVFRLGKRLRKNTKPKPRPPSFEFTTSRTSAPKASNSDESETRGEALNGAQNRNSSSGYVSCSECSYDSETCTCASADRCYCSLGNTQPTTRCPKARDSLVSCCSEDKCYCSYGVKIGPNESTTTYCDCDSDSCNDSSKCYCRMKQKSKLNGPRGDGVRTRRRTYSSDNLALDYELFTIDGNALTGKGNVKPHEALSVKKSAEMAALFADVKLSQTTDVTHLAGSNIHNNNKGGMFSARNGLYTIQSQSDQSKISKEKVILRKSTKSESYYHTLEPNISQLHRNRTVHGSLEDSLGYLP